MIALVVGGAPCVWGDVDEAKRLCSFDAVYCVKQAGIHWPISFDIWVTLHPEHMDEFEAERHGLGLPNGYEIVAPPPEELGSHGGKGRIGRRVSYKFDGGGSASSGIYAAKVALDDGFDVVLAGVPLDDSGHFLPLTTNNYGQRRGDIWSKRPDAFITEFNRALSHLMGRVKSMSGYTMKVLGKPGK